MKKNDRYTVAIENTTIDGYGICRIDGRAVFVQGALTGETWDIQILKVTNTAVWAKGVHCITAVTARCGNDCPNPCGGCTLRHMEYSEELKIKQQYVIDCLQRIGNQSVDISQMHSSESTVSYRNKAIFAVGLSDGHAVFGFYRPRSHVIIPVENCLLQSELCIRAARSVTDFLNDNSILPYDEQTGRGTVRHIFFRQSRCEDAVLCIVSARGFGVLTEALVQHLRNRCPELTGIVLNINKSSGNTVLSGNFYTLWGNGSIRETFCGNTFLISPQAFLQVNPPQADYLYQTALKYSVSQYYSGALADASADDVMPDSELGSLALELYCGAGTISLGLSKLFRKVLAAEIVPEAVENAAYNARVNGVQNVEFICADAGEVADKLRREDLRPDVVLVDPPRKGLTPQIISDVVRMMPEKVVYISCNPATLARDLKLFSEMNYSLVKAEAFDMFPRTAHVETVVCLSNKNAKPRDYVEIGVDAVDYYNIKSAEKDV